MKILRLTNFKLKLLFLKPYPICCIIFFAIFNCNTIANALEQKLSVMRISGSSTVYPFVSFAAENFIKNTNYKMPIIESVGTGGGFQAFCNPSDGFSPDIVSASRPIKQSEIKLCQKNGISTIESFAIGYDAIVLVKKFINTSLKINSKNSKNLHRNDNFDLTDIQIFLALAKYIPVGNKLIDNPYKYWNEIDTSLPHKKIIVYGPPTTSGTRDSFVDLIMLPSCMKNPTFTNLFKDDAIRKLHCGRIRSDGAYIDIGENDNVTVRKVSLSKQAIGILGYDYLVQNNDIIEDIAINGEKIQTDAKNNIFNQKYPLLRPIFLITSQKTLEQSIQTRQFLSHILSSQANGENGYLTKINLIPLSLIEIESERKMLDKYS